MDLPSPCMISKLMPLEFFSVHVIVVHHEFSPLSHSVVGLLHEEYTKSHTDAERSHPGTLPFT
jgi:hypothetical protein